MTDLTVITPKTKDLGGFTVRRALPDIKKRAIGPFVFFDHMGPAVFPAGQGIDVRPHPHIGLATVTFLFDGEFLHQDSVGSHQMVYPGEVNWMIAGRGITHSERTSPNTREHSHPMHGLQVWVALPEETEQTAPSFQHVATTAVPKWDDDGGHYTLVVGDWAGKSAPVKTFSPMHYLILDLPSEVTHTLAPAPSGHESGLYIVSGRVVLDDQTYEAGTLLVLPENKAVIVQTLDIDVKLARIGGVNLGRRHLWWNFVASNQDLIDQAKADYADGKFPLPETDRDEWIPLPPN